VIAVSPDDYFYGKVQLDDVEEIIDALEDELRVERLVIEEADFVEPREVRKNKPTP
jgi:(2Fe-2S) ferredoxin